MSSMKTTGDQGLYTGGCNSNPVYIPPAGECDECAVFEQRLTAVENALDTITQLLSGMGNIAIKKTDTNGATVTVTVLGKAG